jgi:hypothetical protein
MKASGGHYEVTVDGKPRTYRNAKAAAIVAAKYLKRHNPKVEVAVRDLDSGETPSSRTHHRGRCLAPSPAYLVSPPCARSCCRRRPPLIAALSCRGHDLRAPNRSAHPA